MKSAIFRPGCKCNDNERSCHNTTTAAAGNDASEDQNFAARGECAYNVTNLEDQQGQQEDRLQREVLVGFAPTRLERCVGDDQRGTIPGDVADCPKLCSDGRYSC